MPSLIRRPKEDDLPEIEDLARRYTSNPLPTSFVSASVVERFDDITAFGVLENHLEAILFCDGTNRDKVEALKLLINQAIIDARSVKHDALYVYAIDEDFAKILEKFGFRRINKVPMILDL